MPKGLYSLLLPLLCVGCLHSEKHTDTTDLSLPNEEREADVADIPPTEEVEGAPCAPLTALPTVTTLDDISGGFKIEGDLRLKYKAESMRDGGRSIIGTGTPFDNKAFRNEFNLYVYYEGKETIGSVRLKFDNKMGILSGTTNAISVPKAYFARQIFRAGDTYLRLGLGRRPMNEIIESDVQFTSNIDGAFIRFGATIPKFFDFNIDGLGTIVDAQYNYYAYGSELEFNNIHSYGIYFKYAFMSWLKRGLSAITDGAGTKTTFDGNSALRNNPQNAYQTSQFLIGYILGPTRFNVPARFYGAYLINHAAKPQTFLNGKRENTAWYAGFQLGSSKKPGGFSIDYSYQFVRAQAVHQLDMAGIGTGNPRNNNLYGPLLNDFTGAAEALSTSSVNGNTNFKGWELKGLYRYTDHISWRLIYKTSSQANKAIGPKRKFHKFESQWIYAF